jgi:Tfp pilus assembly protein FimT
MRTVRAQAGRRGLTLIDLLTALAVLLIAAALTLSAGGGMDGHALRAAANQLVGDVEYVQSECMAHSDAPRRLVLVPADRTYRVALASATQTPLTHPIDQQPFTTTFGAGRAKHLSTISIAAYSLGGDTELGFGALGQLDQTDDASITLQSGSRTVTITWDATTGEATVGQIQ